MVRDRPMVTIAGLYEVTTELLRGPISKPLYDQLFLQTGGSQPPVKTFIADGDQNIVQRCRVPLVGLRSCRCEKLESGLVIAALQVV